MGKEPELDVNASSLIGNQYTGSIFLALMSAMESDYLDDTDMESMKIGLCGYGSGAKAKVFEGIVQEGWREIASRFHLFERLSTRHAINKTVYEALHREEGVPMELTGEVEEAMEGVKTAIYHELDLIKSAVDEHESEAQDVQ